MSVDSPEGLYRIGSVARMGSYRLIASGPLAALTAVWFVLAFEVKGGWRIVLLIVAAYFLVFTVVIFRQGIRSWRHPPVVQIGSDGLVAYDLFGKRKHADAADIERIEYRTRTYFRSVMPNRVPYVQLHNGTGFFLDAMAASEQSQPDLARQSEMLAEIRAKLSPDSGRPDTH